MSLFQMSSTFQLSQCLLIILPFINVPISSHTLSVMIPEDSFLVECTTDRPCSGFAVSDCLETDKECFINCSNGDGICQDALFHCHPDHDCTLYCDSRNATDSCSGTILNATYSQNTRITIHCLNYRSCQHLVVDTSFSINTSLSMSVRMDPPFVPLLNAEGHLTDIPKYTAKHAAVYLPDSGMATIECEGHSVCHSMAIYGNTTSLNGVSSGVSALNLTISGFHSFKSSYLSIPTRSDVRIWCGLQNQKDALTNSGVHVIGGPCNGAVFDGRDSGMDSKVAIECHGDSACSKSLIISNAEGTSLSVKGDGDRVLSESEIYCSPNDCSLSADGNGSAMMHSVNVHAVNGLDAVSIRCEYDDSVDINCYETDSTAPRLYCDGYREYGESQYFGNSSCSLKLINDTFDEWQCLEEDQSIFCDIDSRPILMSDMLISSTMMGSVEDDGPFDVEVATKAVLTLWTNPKGQIALTLIVGVLLTLCIAVCCLKNEEIKGLCGSGIVEEKGGGVQHQFGLQYGFRGKKGKYKTVKEEDSVLKEVNEIGMDITESDDTFDDSFDSEDATE